MNSDDTKQLIAPAPRETPAEWRFQSQAWRETFGSEERRDPSLTDYLETLRKRLPLLLGGTAIGFFTAIIYCFVTPEMYTADTTLEIRGYAPVLAGVQSETLFGNDTRKIEYAKTTVAKLELEGLADQVLLKDNLAEDLQNYLNGRKGFIDRTYAYLKKLVFDPKPPTLTTSKDLHFIHKPGIIKKYLDFIDINPVHETNLVSISVTSTDPWFSQRLANAHATGFIEHLQRERQESVSANLQLLQRQSTELKSRTTAAEQALAEYADENKLVTLSETAGNGVIIRQIEGLAGLLAEATSKRITSQSLLDEAVEKAGVENTIFDDGTTKDLRATLKQAEAEYAALGQRVTPQFPEMVELKAKMDAIKKIVDGERKRILRGLESRLASDKATENRLREQIEQEKSTAQEMSRRLIQYNVLAKEASSLRDLYQAVLKQVKEIEISAASATSNVFVSDFASVPTTPSAPKKNIIVVMFTLVGFGLGFFLAFLLEAFDKTLKSSQDVQNALDLPVLGVVPRIGRLPSSAGEGTTKKLPWKPEESNDETGLPAVPDAPLRTGIVTADSPNDIVAEALRTIRAGVLLSSADQPPKVLMVTSATKGEGKTTIASNLAVTLAQASQKTILIDCDLRAHRLSALFESQDAPTRRGLADLLTGQAEMDQVIHTTAVPGLDVLPAGSRPPNPAELLGSRAMGELVKALSSRYDFVVIDSPPVLPVADTLVLSRLVDSVLIVVRSKRSQRPLAQEARRRLARVNARVLGTVLNDLDSKVANDYDLIMYEGYIEPIKQKNAS